MIIRRQKRLRTPRLDYMLSNFWTDGTDRILFVGQDSKEFPEWEPDQPPDREISHLYQQRNPFLHREKVATSILSDLNCSPTLRLELPDVFPGPPRNNLPPLYCAEENCLFHLMAAIIDDKRHSVFIVYDFASGSTRTEYVPDSWFFPSLHGNRVFLHKLDPETSWVIGTAWLDLRTLTLSNETPLAPVHVLQTFVNGDEIYALLAQSKEYTRFDNIAVALRKYSTANPKQYCEVSLYQEYRGSCHLLFFNHFIVILYIQNSGDDLRIERFTYDLKPLDVFTYDFNIWYRGIKAGAFIDQAILRNDYFLYLIINFNINVSIMCCINVQTQEVIWKHQKDLHFFQEFTVYDELHLAAVAYDIDGSGVGGKDCLDVIHAETGEILESHPLQGVHENLCCGKNFICALKNVSGHVTAIQWFEVHTNS